MNFSLHQGYSLLCVLLPVFHSKAHSLTLTLTLTLSLSLSLSVSPSFHVAESSARRSSVPPLLSVRLSPKGQSLVSEVSE